MTLDCGCFSTYQSRVISVHSWYLTSLVNLTFCRFGTTFISHESHSATLQLSLISHQREALMCRMFFYEGCPFDLFTQRRFFEDQVLLLIVLHSHTILCSICCYIADPVPVLCIRSFLHDHWYHLFVSIEYHSFSHCAIRNIVQTIQFPLV